MEQLMRKLLVAAALALLTVSSAIAADGLRVVDGDTISIDGMPIRLLQIDTPETSGALSARAGARHGRHQTARGAARWP